MIEAPLLIRLQNFEERHDSIMTYAFTVFASIQKQFYCELANGMSVYPDFIPPEQSPALPFILNNGSTTDIDEVKAAIARQNELEKASASATASAPSMKGASTDTSMKGATTDSYFPNQQQPYQQSYQQPDQQPYQQPYEQPYQQPYQQPTGYGAPDQQQQYYQNMYYQQQQQPQTQNIYAQPDQMQSVPPAPVMEQPQMEQSPPAPVMYSQPPTMEQPQMQPLPQVPQVPDVSQGPQFSVVYSQPPAMDQPQMQPLPQAPVMGQSAPVEEVAE